jgi:hypothetical protein
LLKQDLERDRRQDCAAPSANCGRDVLEEHTESLRSSWVAGKHARDALRR